MGPMPDVMIITGCPMTLPKVAPPVQELSNAVTFLFPTMFCNRNLASSVPLYVPSSVLDNNLAIND